MYDYNTVANQKAIEKNEDIEGDRRGWMWKEKGGDIRSICIGRFSPGGASD
jgi:hypothetical protein